MISNRSKWKQSIPSTHKFLLQFSQHPEVDASAALRSRDAVPRMWLLTTVPLGAVLLALSLVCASIKFCWQEASWGVNLVALWSVFHTNLCRNQSRVSLGKKQMMLCINLSSQADLSTKFCIKPLSEGFLDPGGFVHHVKHLLKSAIKEPEKRNIVCYALRGSHYE